MSNKDYSEQIRLLRLALGLSKKEVANISGVTEQVIINIEAYHIRKQQQQVLSCLINYKEEALQRLHSMATAIQNIEYENNINENEGE